MNLIASTEMFFQKNLPKHLSVRAYPLSADRDEVVVLVTAQVCASVLVTSREAARERGLAPKVSQLLQSLRSIDCTNKPPSSII